MTVEFDTWWGNVRAVFRDVVIPIGIAAGFIGAAIMFFRLVSGS